MRGVHVGQSIGMRDFALTRGKIATVHDKDYERVAQFKWYAASFIGRLYACLTTTLVKNDGQKS